MDQKPTNPPAATIYKRGVFVLVRQFSSGADSYITFRYKIGIEGFVPSFHLAMFNELQFANWYLVSIVDELEKGAKSDILTDSSFLILEVLNQDLWNSIRKTVINGGIAQNAILNPCEETKTHRCPRTCVDFNQYADFNKLKEVFSHYPNNHVTLKDSGKNDIMILRDPTVLIQ